MRYYVKDQKVLANCGTRDEPDWIPGKVIETADRLLVGNSHPYRVRLERESDGKDTWCFPASFIIADNRRNRRNKGLPQVKQASILQPFRGDQRSNRDERND